MKKIPKIRFPEFSGEWEEKKVGKEYDLISGQHLNPDEYTLLKNGTPYFTGPSDFVNDIDKVTKWSLVEGKKAKLGDILFTVKGSGVGTLTILKLPEVVMGRQLMAITSQKNSISFLSQYLKTKKEYFEILASGNMIPGLSRSDILDLKIYFSKTLPEQEEIASFLSSVDSKIEKLERKKELWEQYKKGMMQKIFSQELRFQDENGEDYPEWQIKTIDKIAEISMGFTPDTNDSEMWDGNYRWLSIADMKKNGKYISYTSKYISDKGKKNKFILPKGTLIMSFKLTLGRVGILKEEMFTNEAICNFSWRNSDIITEYIYYYIDSIKIESFGSRAAMGITLNTDSLNSIVVKIPSLSEQTQIADFLSSIDSKIEIVEKELLGMKEFKKGLLQKMFV